MGGGQNFSGQRGGGRPAFFSDPKGGGTYFYKGQRGRDQILSQNSFAL